MCDPLTLAMAAVSAGAAGYSAQSQGKAQNAAIEARKRVMEANRKRNEELQRQAAEQTAKATNAAANSNNPASVNDAQEQRREDLSAVNAAPAVSAAPVGGRSSAPKVVQTEIGRKVVEAGRRNQERTTNTAAMGGYSNLATNQASAMADATRGVNKITDFAGGWERLLPIQLQAATNNAARKGQTGRMIADIIGAVGGAGVQAGTQGQFSNLFGASGPPGMYMGGTGTNPMTGLRFGGV